MNTQSGFTLIEVLITSVVLAGGLLGLAALQATGIKNNQSAYYQSQAMQMANDIADKMRANRKAEAKYLSTFMTPAAATCTTNNVPCTACGSNANVCTSDQLAENDLYNWKKALDTLPKGQGSIAKSGVIYTILIRWDDNRDDAINASDINFMMRMQL